jgi:hypothetical protein
MTTTQAIAINEYMKAESVSAFVFMEKYKLTPKEFWEAYAEIKAKTPR